MSGFGHPASKYSGLPVEFSNVRILTEAECIYLSPQKQKKSDPLNLKPLPDSIQACNIDWNSDSATSDTGEIPSLNGSSGTGAIAVTSVMGGLVSSGVQCSEVPAAGCCVIRLALVAWPLLHSCLFPKTVSPVFSEIL